MEISTVPLANHKKYNLKIILFILMSAEAMPGVMPGGKMSPADTAGTCIPAGQSSIPPTQLYNCQWHSSGDF